MTVHRAAHTRLRALAATLSGLASAFVLILVSAAPASAHAHLVRIDPANRATVTTAPTQVSLTFDETMRAPSAIVVTDPTGTRVEQGDVQVRAMTVTVEVRVARAGRYTVAYRVLSDDGHPVTGQSSFAYQPAGTSTTSPPVLGSAAPPAASAGHAHHNGEPGDASSSGWLLGGIAGLAALGGFGLLAARRRVREQAVTPEDRG